MIDRNCSRFTAEKCAAGEGAALRGQAAKLDSLNPWIFAPVGKPQDRHKGTSVIAAYRYGVSMTTGAERRWHGSVATLPACDGVRQRDGRAVGDRASRLKRLIVKGRPKGDGGQAGLASKVPGYSGFGSRQRFQQLFKRAGLARKDELHQWPTEDHTRRAREPYLDPHDTEVPQETAGDPAPQTGSPAGPIHGG